MRADSLLPGVAARKAVRRMPEPPQNRRAGGGGIWVQLCASGRIPKKLPPAQKKILIKNKQTRKTNNFKTQPEQAQIQDLSRGLPVAEVYRPIYIFFFFEIKNENYPHQKWGP